ncbi:hypothetical protein ABTJ91_20690, partial [Acinetobacter baumannii]
MMQKAGFDSSEVSDVGFLLSLPKYTSPEQVNEFFDAMHSESKKLVPSAIRNYAKWAKLPNRNIIEKLIDYKKKGM